MGFAGSITTVFGKYATFSGRASRPEFWWWILFLIIVGFVFNVIDAVTGLRYGAGSTDFTFNGQTVPLTNTGFGVLSTIWSLAVLLPYLGVTVRRLHDAGHSGWWLLWGYLLALVCCIGFIILLVFMLQPSQQGDNKYGPPPTA
jgi:uncharacterized membrane protein YhaH (DUF805 family)